MEGLTKRRIKSFTEIEKNKLFSFIIPVPQARGFFKLKIMTKIAIPVINGKLNNHFGHTQEFYVYEISNNKILNGKTFTPPPHEPGAYPKWLAEMGVTDVIAGGMGHKAISIFNHNKINVFVGVPNKSPEELVNDFIEGILDTGDNVCDH